MREREEEWRGWIGMGFGLVCVGGLLLMAILPRDVWRGTWERRKLQNVCKYFQHETKSKDFLVLVKRSLSWVTSAESNFMPPSSSFLKIFIIHFSWGDLKQNLLGSLQRFHEPNRWALKLSCKGRGTQPNRIRSRYWQFRKVSGRKSLDRPKNNLSKNFVKNN